MEVPSFLAHVREALLVSLRRKSGTTIPLPSVCTDASFLPPSCEDAPRSIWLYAYNDRHRAPICR